MSEAIRYTTPTELDFWMLDTSCRSEVEVVLGGLSSELCQDFLDHLELWDMTRLALAEPNPPASQETPGETQWVLRLCYRMEWDHEQEQAIHWVDFPDESDPDSGTYARVPRRLHRLLPVVLATSQGRPLRLGPQSNFRRLLESADGPGLSDAFTDLVNSVAEAGQSLARRPELRAAVAQVLKPVAAPLRVDSTDNDLVQFTPEGGSLSDLLRTLEPALSLGPPGHLPLQRHGATTSALVASGEAIASLSGADVLALVDDFGEDLDPISTRHLASVFRERSAQVWLSTRRSSAAEAFAPEDIIRLYVKDGDRRAAQIEQLKTKSERIAARHLSLQLLPAASAAIVAIVEGPHDRAAIEAAAARCMRNEKQPLPAAYGIEIIDAGVVDGSGGVSAVARLADLATRLGFHTIAVIDGDKGDDGAQALKQARDAADGVVRLPDGFAIERAIVEGLSEDVIRQTLRHVGEAFEVPVAPDLDGLTEGRLRKAVITTLKNNGGLHGQFVDLLPETESPATLSALLRSIVDAGKSRLVGVDQL